MSDIEWLFISEIQLCEGTPPSSILCSVPLSYPPPSGATVTPDLSQPDSVSLTCSVASLPTDDYQYQWQWWKNGTQLNNDSRLTITHTTNTPSSSLQISSVQFSDEGEYMCRVQYVVMEWTAEKLLQLLEGSHSISQWCLLIANS